MTDAKKLISFDLKADFGFFKKPDYNDGMLLSYNMLHKPGLLGVLGAIIGLAGYNKKGEFPEYYQKLKSLSIGIQPLGAEKGNFQKTSVKYTNTVGYANQDGTLLIQEVMLIRPSYRCFLLLDLAEENHKILYHNVKIGYAEYIPYLGKNEFQANWLNEDGESTFQEYEYEMFDFSKDFQISSLFRKDDPIKGQRVELKPSFRTKNEVKRIGSFSYFEKIPVQFNTQLFQYELFDFGYSDWLFTKESTINQLYNIKDKQNKEQIIQLFL